LQNKKFRRKFVYMKKFINKTKTAEPGNEVAAAKTKENPVPLPIWEGGYRGMGFKKIKIHFIYTGRERDSNDTKRIEL